MRFVCAVVGVVAALAMGVQAQQTEAAQKQEPAAKVRIIANGVNCPAGMLSARQRTAGGATMWTTAQEDLGKKLEGRAPGSVGVHVEFFSLENPVQSLELSVSYLPLKLRVMPVAQGADNESQKTFVLKQEAARKLDADLLVGPASSIETVHLVSATYKDGSVWRAPSEDACSVEPSRYLPVGDK